MGKHMLLVGAALILLIMLAGTAQSLDFNDLDDQSSLRCSEDVVALGDSARSVREKCGQPLRIARLQDHGPIWIYYQAEATFMYYLEFVDETLQRIVGAPCSPDNPDCFDLE